MKVYYSPGQGVLRISTSKSFEPFYNCTRRYVRFVQEHPEHAMVAATQGMEVLRLNLYRMSQQQVLQVMKQIETVAALMRVPEGMT